MHTKYGVQGEGTIVLILQEKSVLYNDRGPGTRDRGFPHKKGHTNVRPVPTAPYKICKKKTVCIIPKSPAEISAPKKGYTSVYLPPTALFRDYF